MRAQAFVDLVEPACWVALTRFERAAARWTLRTGEPVDLVFRALQVAPPTRETADQVAREARADGLVLDLDAVVPADTTDAHRLLSWAARAGGPGAQRDLAHELWRAHLAEGADVADHTTLAARAAAVGLDADAADAVLASDEGAEEVRLHLTTAAGAGLTTAPTIVLDATYALAGVQPQDGYARALEEVARSR